MAEQTPRARESRCRLGGLRCSRSHQRGRSGCHGRPNIAHDQGNARDVGDGEGVLLSLLLLTALPASLAGTPACATRGRPCSVTRVCASFADALVTALVTIGNEVHRWLADASALDSIQREGGDAARALAVDTKATPTR